MVIRGNIRRSYLASGITCLLAWLTTSTVQAVELPFYIGTYTSGASEGIYRSTLDTDSGVLSQPVLVAKVENPSFLTIVPGGKYLACVSEVPANRAGESRQVFTYEIETEGGLKPLSVSKSYGDVPCYITTAADGKSLLVANYGSGSVAAIRLRETGVLDGALTEMQHSGRSINTSRQLGPHAHCIMTDTSGGFVCAVDLGLDKVIVYKQDPETGLLAVHDSSYEETPGNGPRHIAFHPDGEYAFVIHELSSQLSVCSWDALKGKLTKLNQLSTLPSDVTGSDNSTAEVLVHPSGKFVYGSNRGHDSIAVFQFDSDSGTCTLVDNTSTGGKTPRNFRIDPTGNYLLAENQHSNSIVCFRIDTTTGKLRSTGHRIAIEAPCCITFAAESN